MLVKVQPKSAFPGLLLLGRTDGFGVSEVTKLLVNILGKVL